MGSMKPFICLRDISRTADEVLVVTPTFSMYEIYAGATGARVVQVQCGRRSSSFRWPRLQTASRPATRLIAIASPNNPTGAVASREHLLEIAAAAPDAALLVDEAYFEFHGTDRRRRYRKLCPNLFVARTFSKAYGMAGLRAGILADRAGKMPPVRRVSSPYNVNAVALAVLPVALGRHAITSVAMLRK